MLKTNKFTLIIMSIVTLIPMLIGVILWNHLPDEMAIHFNLHNQADGFSSKGIAVFGIPLFLLVLLWIVAFFTTRDPKKQNIGKKIHTMVLWFIPLISVIVGALLYSVNMGYAVNVPLICELLIGFVLIIIGNYLPKTRQNHSIGIRIPWTLASEDNWNRTHRLAGYLWLTMGILMVVLAMCNLFHMIWLIAILAVIIIIPLVYSYRLHTKKE